MAYTYEFKQPDGTYQTQTVQTDMSNTAGFLSGNIRNVTNGTVSGTQGINEVNTSTNPIQTQTVTPTPTVTPTTQITNSTNQEATGQNTRFKVLNPAGLTGLAETDLVREGQDIYLKPSALSKINVSSGNYKQVNSPLTSQATIPSTIPQGIFNSFYNQESQDLVRSKISEYENAYNQAVDQFTQMGVFDPMEQYNQLTQQSGVLDLQKKLADTDNALRNLDSDIRSQYAGRDVTESQIQAIIAKQSEPILRSRQYLADQVNSILGNIENQIQLGQQGFSNRFNQALQVLGLKKDTLADLKNELYRQEDLMRQGRLDEINLAMTLAQMPKDFEITLGDGTVLKGGGFVEKQISQIQETDASGRVTVSFIDVNPDSPTFGQIVGKTDLGIVSAPQRSGGGSSSGIDLSQWLSTMPQAPTFEQFIKDKEEQLMMSIRNPEQYRAEYNATYGQAKKDIDSITKLSTLGLEPHQMEIVFGIMEGTQPPITTIQRTPEITKILGGLAMLGYDNTKAVQDWTEMQKRLSTLSSASFVRLENSIRALQGSTEQAEKLYADWQSTGLPTGFSSYNRAALLASSKLPGQAGVAARTLLSHIEDMSNELSVVYRLGNTPTDMALESAAKSLQADWNQAQFAKNLELIRQNMRIRLNSLSQSAYLSNNLYTREQGELLPINQSSTNVWTSGSGNTYNLPY
jgi:hypothetical protein